MLEAVCGGACACNAPRGRRSRLESRACQQAATPTCSRSCMHKQWCCRPEPALPASSEVALIYPLLPPLAMLCTSASSAPSSSSPPSAGHRLLRSAWSLCPLWSPRSRWSISSAASSSSSSSSMAPAEGGAVPPPLRPPPAALPCLLAGPGAAAAAWGPAATGRPAARSSEVARDSRRPLRRERQAQQSLVGSTASRRAESTQAQRQPLQTRAGPQASGCAGSAVVKPDGSHPSIKQGSSQQGSQVQCMFCSTHESRMDRRCARRSSRLVSWATSSSRLPPSSA